MSSDPQVELQVPPNHQLIEDFIYMHLTLAPSAGCGLVPTNYTLFLMVGGCIHIYLHQHFIVFLNCIHSTLTR